MEKPAKNSHKVSFLKSLRMYFTVLKAMHKGKGALRIIASYIFFIFAFISLMLTIKVPTTTAIPYPGTWQKTQFRIISGFLIILNLAVYNMIMNWRKVGAFQTAIRIAVIASVGYLDALSVRIIYILIHEGIYF